MMRMKMILTIYKKKRKKKKQMKNKKNRKQKEKLVKMMSNKNFIHKKTRKVIMAMIVVTIFQIKKKVKIL